MFWPQVLPGAVLLVPTGSYEQHGPHLPLDTDTTIASAVARRACRALRVDRPVLVGPAIAYGASGEHQDFPGTVSIGTDALHQALVELGRSACEWASRVVFVNGHGGNLTALRNAVRLLRAEGRDVAWVPCGVPHADAHAGYVETSMMLHMAPDDVDLARAVAGNLEPLDRLMPALVAGGVRSVSPTGVLGDPRGASAEAGAALAQSIVDDVVARVRYGVADDHGRLVAVADATQ
jgi:creatinine amidohydrolase